MSAVLRRIGLRERLAVALAAVAIVAVAVATILADAGLDSRLNQYAHDSLRDAATHTAGLAAALYRQRDGWTAGTVTDLGHLAEMNGYRLTLSNAAGRSLSHGELPPGGARASAAVTVAGRSVGRVTVAPVRGQILTGEDRSLHSRLNSLHLLAGGIALLLGLLVAVVLARALARPLNRLTDAARRMQRGELDARVAPAGAHELQELAGAFNHLSETLEHLEQMRRDAAADLAHELRTPLAGIVSRIEAAQDGVLPDEQANLEAMRAEALRLTALIAGLGRLSEAQQPGLTLRKESVDLHELVRQRTALFGDTMREKGVQLQMRLGDANAYGDSGRIVQIVDNLLANAVRYTDPGGTVNVELTQLNGEARLDVIDTGIGIASDDLPYIFERFWRAERSRARSTGGAGIGLAIVAELVRAHGGRITVESKPGEGSRFHLTLPSDPPT